MRRRARWSAIAVPVGSMPAAALAPDHPPTSPAAPAGRNVSVPAPPPVPPLERARVDDVAAAADGLPLAGDHNGLFYLRDHDDNFHLYIQGRSQVDFYRFLGGGVPETALKPTLFVRRVAFSLGANYWARRRRRPRGRRGCRASSPAVS